MKLQLSIRATGLTNVAGVFKGTSDPFAVVTLLPTDRYAKPVIIGKTEVIKNTLDPDFVKTFLIDYEFGTQVNVLIKIFDMVADSDNIPMGSARFEIGNVLGAKGNSKAKKTQQGGTIFVRVTEAKDCGSLTLKMNGLRLTNTEGFLRKSDPFYQFVRKDMGQRGSEWNVVHKSEKIKNSLNPNWDEESIDIFALCGGDLDLPLEVQVLDHESDGNHVMMGSVETSVNGLIAMKDTDGVELEKEGEKTGTLFVQTAEIVGMDEESNDAPDEEVVVEDGDNEPTVSSRPATFMDYINGGCEISLSVAIDFTGSNGDPRKPGTLHYMDPEGGRNDYQKAIAAIGEILAGYDSDKKFPVWGFGAKYSGQVYHCFQCGPDAEADGIEGVLNAYNATFQSGLVMSSPTDITEVLNTAAAFARSGQEQAEAQGKQKYSVLLILTDGSVSDVGATIDTLNTIADSPLSVVIVGIGNADFTAMEFLDDAGSGLDVCQFVEFNAYSDDFSGLTRATLAEIPNQLTSYYSRHGIGPNAPVEVVEEDIVVEPEEEDIVVDMEFHDNGKVSVTSGGGVFVPRGAY